MRYTFDGFELDVRRYELRQGGTPVALEPQVFDVLAYLVQNHDRVVPKQELLDHIWPERYISEAALNSRLMAARRALGDTGKDQRYIKTIHGRGFRFVADVSAESSDAPAAAGPAPQEPPPRVQYARTEDGHGVAYSVTGIGPPLVRVLGWFTHLELEWRWQSARRLWERLAERHTLVRYDGRGIGMSEPADWFSLDTRLADLEAVVNAAGLERFALMGMSEGVLTAVHYAARNPERVTHLICYGFGPDGDEEEQRAWTRQWDALVRLMREGWGSDTPVYRQFFAHLFLGPHADPSEVAYFTEMQRASAASRTAVHFAASGRDEGSIEAARLVKAPALVMHRRGDALVPFARSRRLAAAIPGARLLTLEGDNHWLLLDDAGAPEFVRAIEEFTGACDDAR